MGFSLDDLRKRSSNELATTKNGNGGSLASLKNKQSRMSIEDRMNSLAKKNIGSAALELRKNTAEIIFIIDKSNSCKEVVPSTIKAIDNLIRKERRNCYPTKISIILFNHTYQVICDRQDIKNVYEFCYKASGGTALYDTLCNNLYAIKERQLKSKDVDSNKTIVVIMTDGEDNESVNYSLMDARKCILECKSIGWKFIFLGANINAKKVASDLGIDLDLAEEYQNNARGVIANFESINRALIDVRATGSISKNWSDNIKYNNRINGNNQNTLSSGKKKMLRLGGK